MEKIQNDEMVSQKIDQSIRMLVCSVRDMFGMPWIDVDSAAAIKDFFSLLESFISFSSACDIVLKKK